jgi:hypothetical protein
MALTGMRAYQGSGWPTHIRVSWNRCWPPSSCRLSKLEAAAAPTFCDACSWGECRSSGYLVSLSPLAFFVLASLAVSLTGQGWPDFDQLGTFASLGVVVAGRESQWLGSRLTPVAARASVAHLDRMFTSAQTCLECAPERPPQCDSDHASHSNANQDRNRHSRSAPRQAKLEHRHRITETALEWAQWTVAATNDQSDSFNA